MPSPFIVKVRILLQGPIDVGQSQIKFTIVDFFFNLSLNRLVGTTPAEKALEEQ